MIERKKSSKKKSLSIAEEEKRIQEDESKEESVLTDSEEPVLIENTKAEKETKEEEFTVESICTKNRFPLSFGSIAVGGFIADLIDEDRKLIIEVEKEGRDSQERVNAFYKFKYKVLFIPRYSFNRPKAEEYITKIIGRFIG